ncbi:hypothetical protein R5H30_05140 [Sulfitobacter sp. D35]|uniref:hypothetical protein n=1 Tax=Sulfitobacter sp. D35 TaxID=3083252 RepID=UPI00296FCD76|nr:hypothetical protein [Sulfitobacter sp. D35]MDW4497358.1 hypothetical protein [Sulfitobacter sp. D35]
MMRWFAILLLMVPVSLAAQDASAPVVRIDMEETEAIPGQYLTMRVTVLVPTFMPKPVEFPSFEMPNLRVLLPENSTNPTSQNVDGETWSGVSRRYRLSPMVPGRFDIPSRSVRVTYADPETGAATDPLVVTVETDPVSIAGVLPQGAEGLDPFIAATGLSLEQELSGPTTDLDLGAGVTRTVTATIEGASPIVLPPLLSDVQITGVDIYPDEPRITEAENRGELSGTRVESETLMAAGGGAGTVPALTLDWYNLDTGEIETASVEGFDVSVSGPPRDQPTLADRLDPRLIAAGVAVLVALALLLRFAWPRLVAARHARQAARLAGKAHAEREAMRAIRARDLDGARRWIDEWARRAPVTEAPRLQAISEAMTRIGAHRFGPHPDQVPDADWTALKVALQQRGRGRVEPGNVTLAPLNPS